MGRTYKRNDYYSAQRPKSIREKRRAGKAYRNTFEGNADNYDVELKDKTSNRTKNFTYDIDQEF